MGRCQVCGTSYDDGGKNCPRCGTASGGKEASANVNIVDAPRRRRWLVYTVVCAVFTAGIWMFYEYAFREYHPVIAAQPEVTTAKLFEERISSSVIHARIEGSFLIVSLKEVVGHRIVRFFDPESQQAIPVLAYITPSGRVVTAMALSEGCRSTDFYLQGENIHCASCPSYWNASSLEAYACCQKYYPDPIESSILGDELRLDIVRVRTWQARS